MTNHAVSQRGIQIPQRHGFNLQFQFIRVGIQFIPQRFAVIKVIGFKCIFIPRCFGIRMRIHIRFNFCVLKGNGCKRRSGNSQTGTDLPRIHVAIKIGKVLRHFHFINEPTSVKFQIFRNVKSKMEPDLDIIEITNHILIERTEHSRMSVSEFKAFCPNDRTADSKIRPFTSKELQHGCSVSVLKGLRGGFDSRTAVKLQNADNK